MRISIWVSFLNRLARSLKLSNIFVRKHQRLHFVLRKPSLHDLFLKLYEHCVKPILLYCSEVWCLDKKMNRSSNIEHKYDTLLVEKVQLKFCKMLLVVHKSAANNAVKELGIFPLVIFCLKSCLNYWLHILEMKDDNLINNAYRDVISCDSGFHHNMKLFLEKLNFSHVWANQSTFSKANLLHAVTTKLKDSYVSFWSKCLFDDSSNVTTGNGNKLRTYRTFKTSYCHDLVIIQEKKLVSTFAKNRISCHKLRIEEGRHRNYLCKRECANCAIERCKMKNIL